MKSTRYFVLALGVACFALPAASFAKKDKAMKPGKIVRMYDTNGNGIIDGAEIDAVRKAYEADLNGPLKQFDTDNDGKLSDSEIAAMKAKGGKKKKNK